MTVENGGIEVQYWNKDKTQQITDVNEIQKLGLDTSKFDFRDYTFSVRYKAKSNNGQVSISGGQTIKVVSPNTVSDLEKGTVLSYTNSD